MKRKNALILFVILVVAILILDRVTKVIAVDQLTGRPPVAFVPLLLDFILVYNTGGAFGLFAGGGYLFVGVAALAVIAIIIYLIKAKKPRLLVVIAVSMMAAGAMGNAYDRAVSGMVPDFIHTMFIEFPVFNVADMALTVGEIGLLILVAIYWFGPKKTPETEPDAALEPDTASEPDTVSELDNVSERDTTPERVSDSKTDTAPEQDTAQKTDTAPKPELDAAPKIDDTDTRSN